VSAPGPLARKLGVKTGQRVVVLDAPDGVLAALEPLPEGASVATAAGGAPADVVLVFTPDAASVAARLPAASAVVKERGMLWVAYPKGGTKAGTDLNRDILWRQLETHGLAGVSLVAVDEKWSAMRARPAAEVGT
jgi:hypothetical protein